MVDTKDLKSFGGNAVRVRVPPGAHEKTHLIRCVFM